MAERRNTRIVAGVGVLMYVDEKPIPCMTRNVSRGGLFVVIKSQLKEGNVVKLEIMHNNKRLPTQARVAKVTKEGLGLTFIDPTAAFVAGIEAMVLDLVRSKSDTAIKPSESRVQAEAFWSPPDGSSNIWKFLGRKRNKVTLASLSLDGAALVGKDKPALSETVVVTLKISQEGIEESCNAEVVRYTDRGFAVRFVSPSREFRSFVSRLRQG